MRASARSPSGWGIPAGGRRCSVSRRAPTSSYRASARGSRTRSGSGADAVRGRNPRLVYCSVSAPAARVARLRHEPGYDALMQAAGGLILDDRRARSPRCARRLQPDRHRDGRVGDRGVPHRPPRTGAQGRKHDEYDVSLYETTLTYIGYHLAGYLADGADPAWPGTVFPMVAPFPGFPTRDGERDRRRQRQSSASICDVLGLPELVADPALCQQPCARRAPRGVLGALVDRPPGGGHDHVAAAAAGKNITKRRSRTCRSIMESPETEALGMLHALESLRGSTTNVRRGVAALTRRGTRVPPDAPRP